MPTKDTVEPDIARALVVQEIAVSVALPPPLELDVSAVILSVIELKRRCHNTCLSS